MEVADHCVASPPSHQADGISLDTCEEERHFSVGAQGAHTAIRLGETQSWSHGAADGAEVWGGIINLYDAGTASLEYCGKEGVRWVIVV